MSAIKGREKQVIENRKRVHINIESRYYGKIKRIAKAQQKSISKLLADTIIIYHQLDKEREVK